MKMVSQSTSQKPKVESRKSKIHRLLPSVYSLKSKVQSLRPKASPRAAFTLIELLVVLAVIGLLMGLLFPALMGARERAKITRARSEIQTLQQAWLAYWNVYGSFPSYTEMNADAVKVLGGEDIDDNNPQRIAFMEFDERHRSEGFLDPWWNGRTENIEQHQYRIELNAETPPDDVEWHFTTRAHCVNTARYHY